MLLKPAMTRRRSVDRMTNMKLFDVSRLHVEVAVWAEETLPLDPMVVEIFSARD
jgi:hypothetical protein